MRVAVIEPSGRLYGSEYCLLDVIDGLPRNRFDWRVFLPRGRGLDELLLDRRIHCDFLIPGDLGQWSRWRKAGLYAALLQSLRRAGPALLYVNQAGSLRYAAMCARWLALPIVCQVQTLEDARWLSARPRLHRPVQAFVCNSQFIAAETSCDPKKKCVLYQGVSSERVSSARRHAHQRRERRPAPGSQPGRVIGILGRIAVSKGHYLLLQAAERLRSVLPGCRYVVIGEGLTSDDTEDFRAAVAASGLSPDFEFRGYRTDLAQELESVDLLVIPSLAEPLGRVLLDAAAFGVPVIVSDAGGLGEISNRFRVGVRFRSSDAGALARAVVHASENYAATCEAFWAASSAMLERLPLRSYLQRVEHILLAAADRRPVSETWLGDE